jgi:hypothetical protein
MKCVVCLKSLTPRFFFGRITDGCAAAPLLCPSCRQHPKAFDIAEKLLMLHLEEHRDRGDFDKLRGPTWSDPGRRRDPKRKVA